MRKFLILLFLVCFWGSGLHASDAGITSLSSLLAPAPAASAFPNPVCVGSKLNLYATGGSAYYWQGPNGFTSTDQNPVINVTTMQHIGTYSVTISLPNSGTIVKSVDVMVEPISPDAVADESLCEGATSPQIDFSGGNFYTQYEWTNDNTNIGLAAYGINNVPAFVATNNTNSPITGHISVNLIKPSTPVLPKVINYADRISTYTNVSLDGGSNYKEVAPGQNVNLSFDYNTYFAGGYCTGCITELYIGVGTTTATLDCKLYGGGNFNSSGSTNVNFTAPTTPGYYYVVQTGTLDYSCIPQNFPNTGGTAIALFKVAEPNIQPNSSLNFIVASYNCTVSNIYLDGGPNVKKVAPGANVNLAFDYNYVYFTGGYCPGCIVQVYAGLGETNNTIVCNSDVYFDPSGTASGNFTAPTTPGIYYIVMASTLDYSCQVLNYGNSPDQSIAMIIVDQVCPSVPISFDITVNPTPDATASASPNPACVGQTLNLSASGGTSYSWSGPIGFTSNLQNPVINNVQQLQAGTYTVTVTSGDGCTATASVNVTVNPIPDAFALAIPNPICQGETLSLYGLSNNGISYAWSGPNGFSSNMQNPVIMNIQPVGTGVYTLTVTNSNGCTNTSTVSVTVNPQPVAVASASPNPICVGKTLSLTSSGGTSYSWSGPAGYSSNLQNPTIVNIQLTMAGVYTVTVTNQNGCTKIASVNVVVNTLPVATAGASPNPICVGKTLSLTASGGTSYSWSGPAGFSSFIQNPSIVNIQLSQGGIYTVTVTNTSGCSNTASVTVIVNPLPNATATVSPNPVCEGEVAKFSANGGVGYHWSGPNGFTTDNKEFGLHMALNMAGTYYVTVTNSNGCSKTASVSVTVNPGPNATASVSPNPACSGQTVQFSASGGTTYSWTGPFGFASNLQNPVINNVQQYHSGSYTVVVSNGGGCTKTLTLSLKVYQSPAGQISYDAQSTCTGSTLLLYASGGTSYQWSGPAGFTSTMQNPTRPNANSTFSGTYTVMISNSSGCSVTLSVNVTIRPLPTITAWTTTPEVCEGGTAYLYATGGTSYSWSGPYGYSSTFQNPIITNIPIYMTGIYTVTAANEYGCTTKANVFITVQSVNAIVNATPNPVPNGGTLYLTASGGTSYQWTGPNGFHTTQQNPIIYRFTQPNEGLYSCIVSSSAGCQDTKIILVQVKTNGIVGQNNSTQKMEGNYVQVFPNPASTSIKLDDGFTGKCDYRILNGQGQIVMTGQSSSGEQIQINTLAPGAYYIHWNYQNENDKKVSNISRFVKTN